MGLGWSTSSLLSPLMELGSVGKYIIANQQLGDGVDFRDRLSSLTLSCTIVTHAVCRNPSSSREPTPYNSSPSPIAYVAAVIGAFPGYGMVCFAISFMPWFCPMGTVISFIPQMF